MCCRAESAAQPAGAQAGRAQVVDFQPLHNDGSETRMAQRPARAAADCGLRQPHDLRRQGHHSGQVLQERRPGKRRPGSVRQRSQRDATKGILVTTSGFGKASFDFASDRLLELLAGTRLLYSLEHTEVNAKIEPPEHWSPKARPAPHTGIIRCSGSLCTHAALRELSRKNDWVALGSASYCRGHRQELIQRATAISAWAIASSTQIGGPIGSTTAIDTAQTTKQIAAAVGMSLLRSGCRSLTVSISSLEEPVPEARVGRRSCVGKSSSRRLLPVHGPRSVPCTTLASGAGSW